MLTLSKWKFLLCISNTIFAGQFNEVLEIRKSNDVLLVEMENKKRVVIKKSPCLGGAVIENI